MKGKLKWTILLAAVGFLGAGVFYSPYLGLKAQTALTCPLCPNTTSCCASLATKFVLYTFVGGTLNAVSLIAVGWIIWGITRIVKLAR